MLLRSHAFAWAALALVATIILCVVLDFAESDSVPDVLIAGLLAAALIASTHYIPKEGDQ